MGTQVDRLPVQGLAIPSRLVSPDTLRPFDADTPASVFQQAEPAAGAAAPVDADSRLQLDLTGGQEAEIEITVVQGGLPGLNGLGVVYRFTSEATDDAVQEAWRGRGEPVAFTDAVGLADAVDHHDLVVTAGSHALLLVYIRLGQLVCRPWEGDDWGSVETVAVADVGGVVTIDDLDAGCATAMPDESILAIGRSTANDLRSWRSTDDGDSWEEVSHRAGTYSGTAPALRCCFYRGDVLLLGTHSTTLRQFASADLGATFSEIYSGAVVYGGAIAAAKADCAVCPCGIVVAYTKVSTGYLYVRILGAAGQPFDTADEIEVNASSAHNSVTVEVSENGAIYVYAAVAETVVVYVSFDFGATWSGANSELLDLGSGGSALYHPTNLAAAWYRGRLALAHQVYSDPLGSPALVGQPCVVFSGGWSNLAPSVSSAMNAASWTRSQWVCGALTGLGWTAGGATAATTTVGRFVQWNVSASDGFLSVTAGTEPAVAFQATCKVVSGTPSVATLTHGAALRKANGTYEFILEVRIGATSIVAYDRNGAATLGTLDIDCTEWVQIYAFIDDSDRATVYARLATSSRWLRVCAVEDLTDNAATPAAAGAFSFGVVNASTCVVQWRAVARDEAELYRCGLTTIVPPDSNHTFGPLDQGALLSARGAALPDVGSTTRAALLSARRGPGRRSERVTISPVYTYGVGNFFPRLAESPDRVWRSTDKTACSFVFDLGEYDGKLGPDWIRVLGLFRANFRKAFLESSADGSSWTLRDTWDAATGFVDLDYELQGQTIRPTSGTASGARPLHRNELAGGYAIFDNTTALEIRGNSAGVWASPTGTTKWAEVEVIGDVSGLGATGEVVLVFPNAVSFGRFSGVRPTLVDRFWRVRIATAEITPWSYLQIGKLFLGDAVVFGKRSSRGWQREVRPNARRSISRYGTIRKRQDGPPAGRWTLGWADGEQQARHRAGLADVDYVRAGSSGPALAMRDDVYASVVALLEETRSGEVPVLALASIPDEATTINDRSLFLYGSLEGGASFGQVDGREGYDAFGRVDPITIDEIR